MSVLITGSLGFIGQALTKRLDSSLGVDSLLGLSTLRPEDIKPLLHNNPCRQLIHLGMASSEREYLENPQSAEASIIQGTQNMLELSREFAIKHFIFASSSMVYGSFSGEVHEESPCAPQDHYGSLKKKAEVLVEQFCREHQIDFTIFRPIAVYGPHDSKQRVLSKLYNNARSGLAMHIHGQNTYLDFTYIDDVVDGIELILRSPHARNQYFNLSYGKAQSLSHAAQIIQSFFPHSSLVIGEESPLAVKRGTLNNTKIKSLLGFTPRYDLKAGLEKMHEAQS